MSRSVTPKRPRCHWCGHKIKGKLRQASRGRGKYWCDEGCGPKRRGRTRKDNA